MIPIIKIRWSWDHHLMVIPILVGPHLYVETLHWVVQNTHCTKFQKDFSYFAKRFPIQARWYLYISMPPWLLLPSTFLTNQLADWLQSHIDRNLPTQMSTNHTTKEIIKDILGAVSIRKTVLPGMAIPMLKIRRPNGRLIFNMENAIRR